MQLPEFKRSYTWGRLIGFESGPRREITLFIRDYPSDLSNRHSHKWKENRVPDPVHCIRFGGVENFDEVHAFFRSVKRKKHMTPIVDWIAYDSQQKSKSGQLFIRMFFDSPGVGVTVQCSNFVESENLLNQPFNNSIAPFS